MMERIGFSSELEARKCVSWLNNNYQVPAYVVTAGKSDRAKIFLEVSERWSEVVYLNFKKFIV